MNRIAVLLVIVLGMASSTFAQVRPLIPLGVYQEDSIVAIAWKPDGTQYVSVNNNGDVEVFDTETDELITLITADDPYTVMDAAWNFDGTLLAVTDGMILEIWDAVDWQLIHSLEGHSFPIWRVSWHPMDNHIVSIAFGGSPRNIRIWDAELGQQISMPKSRMLFTSGVWSPHEENVVLTTGGSRAQRWSNISNVAVTDYLFLENSVSGLLVDLAIHPFENWVAMVGYGDPEIWNIADQTLVQSFNGHIINPIDEYILTVAFNPSGEMIATAGTDKTVRIWDVETGEQLDIIEAGDYVYALAFSPDGTRLAYGGVDGLHMFMLDDEEN